MKYIKLLTLLTAVSSVVACSSTQETLPELDYQSKTGKVVDLSVPPDLTNPNQGALYQLPAGQGAVRASEMNRGGVVQNQAEQKILAGVEGVQLQREGNQRWLEITGKQPAEVWALLKAFWLESGFIINHEEPAIGQMETDWAENRAKLGADGLRSVLEFVGFGGIYSAPERDKFIIRIESKKSGVVDVFFAHKGMQEVYTSKSEDNTVWQARDSDPNLEAAFLARFMQYLGLDAEEVKKTLSTQSNADQQGKGLARIDGRKLLLSGEYERNWRRVALALDRIGLTVKGQNTSRKVFLIEVAPQEGEAVSKKEPSIWNKWFGLGSDESEQTPAKELLALVEPVQQGVSIQLLNRDGSAYQGKELNDWLARLHKELR